MKPIRLLIATLLLVLARPLYASQTPLSLAFDDAPVAQILQALADYQQLNLLVAPGVEGRLSIRLKEVSWQQALSLISRLAQLHISTEDNVLLVFPLSWQAEKQRQQALEREEAEKTLPLKTLALTLRYAEAEKVNASLQASRARLMTSRGSVTVDTRTNSLVLYDTQAALDNVQRWVATLDTPLEQVELAAHIVTISKESLRELGVRWGMSGEEQISQALRASQLRVEVPVANPAMTFGFTLARMNGRLLDLELSALEQENQLEIIASPRLFTSHQQPASIKQGTEIPYEVSSGTSGGTSVEFKEAVLGMDVTPVVQPNGRIMLKLHISQNLPGSTIRNGEGEYIAIDKQEIQTQVTLKDGQTLALGGIFQQQSAKGQRKVPLMGDIPLLGTLFRHATTEQKRRELVIFITPRLIRDE
ncbi:DNA uptake porin HofQ [Erwinia sp. BNK-24-b]|uniref:DNA uptake porin HofQ n=1 Tax=Erwinia TaxID=551 RepID=UPI001FEF9EAB|nr:DNA uptake porin HofQ [Erwinia phyllosphaerae]MBV4368333.1 DNA uptake porin HofQ [Erwinia phyllosphaerae]